MSSTPFRFRDLPSEIRNKVYGELLCSFGPRPTTADLGNTFKLASARHTIDTAILRTNKTTYLEAYDVMIKKNRFVKNNFHSRAQIATPALWPAGASGDIK